MRTDVRMRVINVSHSRPSVRLHAISLEAPLFDGATNIQRVSLADAEKLYVSLAERANDSHVLMVLYAPWCKYCTSMESEVRRLARGLSHESGSLSILALDCDAPATRYFAKHVLGTPSLPAFCIFPKNSRTFFKYKGTSRDANSLLKFINMVCNQNEERLWELSGAEAGALEEVREEEKGSTRIVSVSQNPDARVISAIGVPAELVPHVTIAARLTVGIALLVGTYFIIKSRQQAALNDAEVTLSEARPKEDASNGTAEVSPMQQLVSDIDSTIGRMWGVMVRLMKARVGLVLAPVDDEEPAAKTLPPPPKAEESSRSLNAPPSVPAMTPPLPPPLPVVSKPNMSAEQVLAMLDEDKGDVGKTIERMMKANPSS
jgi:hypothetical protein